MIRLSSASNLSQLKGRLILWKLNNSRWKNSIASVFIAVLETFLIYNDLTTKEFWYILMLTVPIERTNMPKRLDDTVSVSFFWIATTLTEIYQISVIHTTNLLEEIHMSVRLYVLAFLIITISFVLGPTGLIAEEWVFVDLKPKANSRLDQQWWTGEKAASTLSFLPIGKTEDFAGPNDKKVKFKIEKECVVVFWDKCC